MALPLENNNVQRVCWNLPMTITNWFMDTDGCWTRLIYRSDVVAPRKPRKPVQLVEQSQEPIVGASSDSTESIAEPKIGVVESPPEPCQ